MWLICCRQKVRRSSAKLRVNEKRKIYKKWKKNIQTHDISGSWCNIIILCDQKSSAAHRNHIVLHRRACSISVPYYNSNMFINRIATVIVSFLQTNNEQWDIIRWDRSSDLNTANFEAHRSIASRHSTHSSCYSYHDRFFKHSEVSATSQELGRWYQILRRARRRNI